jgi:hypothetical protein
MFRVIVKPQAANSQWFGGQSSLKTGKTHDRVELPALHRPEQLGLTEYAGPNVQPELRCRMVSDLLGVQVRVCLMDQDLDHSAVEIHELDRMPVRLPAPNGSSKEIDVARMSNIDEDAHRCCQDIDEERVSKEITKADGR